MVIMEKIARKALRSPQDSHLGARRYHGALESARADLGWNMGLFIFFKYGGRDNRIEKWGSVRERENRPPPTALKLAYAGPACRFFSAFGVAHRKFIPLTPGKLHKDLDFSHGRGALQPFR
jgi:hypothetical protein